MSSDRIDGYAECDACGELREGSVVGVDTPSESPRSRGPVGLVRVSAERHARRHPGHVVTFQRVATVVYSFR